MKKLSNFLFSSFQTQKLIIEILGLIIIIRVGLWLLPYKWLNRQVERFNVSQDEAKSPDWVLIYEIAHTIKSCSNYVPKASCLTQALTAQVMMGLKKQKSVLRIGVDKDSFGALVAHAWVEIDGKIIIGKSPDILRYKTLFQRKQQLI